MTFKQYKKTLRAAILWSCCSYVSAEIHSSKTNKSYIVNSYTHYKTDHGTATNKADTPWTCWNSGTVTEMCELIQILLVQYQPWICSLIASVLVGLSGIFPLFIIPIERGVSLKKGGGRNFQMLLSFAVGGLLGDVFLHLLPEAWKHLDQSNINTHHGHMCIGFWVLLGIFTFVIVEIMFIKDSEQQCKKMKESDEYQTVSTEIYFNDGKIPSEKTVNNNIKISPKIQNGYLNGHCVSDMLVSGEARGNITTSESKTDTEKRKNVSGYLNLLANSIDNFTHGLAVAGSFLVSFRVGAVTTLTILIHEIPHEVGDFAILLKSGFSRWEAAKAQMSTSTVGLLGAIAALTADSTDALGEKTAWILPFTAGGFINIALVTVMPDLLKEEDPWESMKQLLCMLAGIGVIAIVTLPFE